MTAWVPILTGIHLLAAIVWVGGMFFAYMALRPATAEMDGPGRLRLWRAALGRFFAWVWVAIATLLVTGYLDVAARFGGIGQWPGYLHGMQDLGLVMVALFTGLYFGPFRRLKACLAADDTGGAARAMVRIRRIVATNLTLGLVVAFIGAAGPYL